MALETPPRSGPPKSSDILKALRSHYRGRAHAMRRLTTGLAHFVYEIMTDEEPLVVRMADPGYWNGIPGGVYWHSRLKALGVPLPELVGYNLEAPYPYMILQRIPGTDLGHVYGRLTTAEKTSLARRIAAIQDRVARLPQARWYGWLDSLEAPGRPFNRWTEVIESGLVEAERNIRANGLFDVDVIERVRQAAAPFEPYLAGVPPAPFLDDTTTKNVIVHDGKLSGIVDVDVVCFGDRLDVVALTHMALLSDGQDTVYIDAWAEAWELTAEQIQLMHLYTAMHGVYFMGELGQPFNQTQSKRVDPEHVDRLNRIVHDQLGRARAAR